MACWCFLATDSYLLAMQMQGFDAWEPAETLRVATTDLASVERSDGDTVAMLSR